MKGIAAAFLKILNKNPEYHKSLGIHLQGSDNAYPDIVERAISESVTASTCASIISSYISGKGFGEQANNVIVNHKKGLTLLEFSRMYAQSMADHNGVFIHVNYDGNYNHSSLDVLPFADCRIGKKDDDNYNGKILVCNDWSSGKIAKKAKKVDVFNPTKEVVKAQILHQKGIENYNGQILYIKRGRYIYPLAPMHAALNDAVSEKKVSKYKETSLGKGFFGKTMVITKPLVDAAEEEGSEEYAQQISKRNKFRETIQSFIGVENADGVLHLELEFHTDSIEDEILFKQIDTNIDDKLFAHTERSVSENICVAYSVHPNLVRPQDGAMFGSGGEVYKQMKLDVQDKTEDRRLKLQETVAMLMANFKTPLNNLQIIPLLDANYQSRDSEI